MRRRKEGKVPPLILQHVPPEAYLLAYEQALLRFPGVRGVGEGREPQESLLAGYLLAGYTHIGLLLFLDVLVQTRALRKERERFLQLRLQDFPLTLATTTATATRMAKKQ